jgi:hypothetical protein
MGDAPPGITDSLKYPIGSENINLERVCTEYLP